MNASVSGWSRLTTDFYSRMYNYKHKGNDERRQLVTEFNDRAEEHIEMLTHQMREGFVGYAAEVGLTGAKLAEMLKERGVTSFEPAEQPIDGVLSRNITEEFCDFMLEHAEQLALGDVLVLLEALGVHVNITCTLPIEVQKKLLTPRKQHRLQVARHLDELPRKLKRKAQEN